MITTLDKPFFKTVCNHCLAECTSLKRCSKCKHLRYCSERCQRDDWKLHKAECPHLCKIPLSNQVPSLIRLCGLLVSSSDLRSTLSIDSMMKHESLDNEKIIEYYPFVLKGVMEMLKGTTKFKAADTYDIYNKLVVNLFTLEDEQLRTIGSALIPEISKLNHSCDPNCVLSFKGRTAYITAIKEIPKATELTISYIPLPQSFLARKNQLQTQFNFTCHCSRCDMQRTKGIDDMLMRECPMCKEHSHPAIDFEKDELMCPSCGNSLTNSSKVNDLILKNIESFDSPISTRAQQDVEIINYLVDETEKLIIEKRWEAALRTGLKATVGLMDWAQNYPSTGLFIAKLGKLYMNQEEANSPAVYMDNINRAIQLFDVSLKCLSLSLSRNHACFMEVEMMYKESQAILRSCS